MLVIKVKNSIQKKVIWQDMLNPHTTVLSILVITAKFHNLH